MTPAERIHRRIREEVGLELDPTRIDGVDRAIAERLRVTGCADLAHYEELLAGVGGAGELDELAQGVVIGETYFLRHLEQLLAFVRRAPAAEPLRLLSAGCSTGEEAYSLAILVTEHLGREVAVDAVDIRRDAVAHARAGRYAEWAFRQTPERIKARYFVADGNHWRIAAGIAKCVSFQVGSLTRGGAGLPPGARYHAVFCRNVLMYLTQSAARDVVGRLAERLLPGGYLFLGHAETLRGLSQAFALCQDDGAFFYQLRGATSAHPPREIGSPPDRRWPPSSPPPPDPSAWIDGIGAATDRIRALSTPALPLAATRPVDKDLVAAAARRALSHERYDEALGQLDRVPPSGADEPEVLLLRAAAFTNQGRIDQARATCRRLLEVDDLCAGAHFFLALCHEYEGEIAAAIRHNQAASYLDPGLVMPQLHQGLLLRKQGDPAGARRALRHALELLELATPDQLLVYGGGFSRATLTRLCLAELGGGET